MAEIDLVPDDFRKAIHTRLIFFKAAAFVSFVIILAIGGKIWLERIIAKEAAEVERLEAEKKAAGDESVLISQYQEQKQDLTAKQALLKSLREGYLAERMFVAVSRSIDPSGWVTNWKFFRCGEAKINNFQQKIPTAAIGAQNMKDRPRMEITGIMLNHAALVNFVGQLLKRPEIADVQIIRTNANEYSPGSIEYQLEVALK